VRKSPDEGARTSPVVPKLEEEIKERETRGEGGAPGTLPLTSKPCSCYSLKEFMFY